mmetsp:Transcript_20644/g.26679  ORF Transcript_20644/g.26679 Transcript_20644/m.26679 type:complete len:236 (-) Transcript_20644:93-800(-)
MEKKQAPLNLPAISELTGKADDDHRTPPDPPDLEGFLYKLKHKSRPLLGSWNKRWFQVNPNQKALVYFRNKADASRRSHEPDGAIMLDDLMGLESFDDLSFQLETRSRTFHLKADSKIEKHGWATALEDYLLKKKEYDRWLSVHTAVAEALAPPASGKSSGYRNVKVYNLAKQEVSSEEDEDRDPYADDRYHEGLRHSNEYYGVRRSYDRGNDYEDQNYEQGYNQNYRDEYLESK